jgi:tetratricopeptide (TPR) repeat protein/peroxiredoxin
MLVSVSNESSGGISLRRTGKKRPAVNLVPSDGQAEESLADNRLFNDLFNPGRRDFLIRCCQGASAVFLPRSLRGAAFPFAFASDPPQMHASESGFHLHPHYRAQLPIEATLHKTDAALDDFITEKYQDQIASILARWSSSLLKSPQDLQAIESVLAPDFVGTSFRPIESRRLRPGPAVQVHTNKFKSEATLDRGAFLRELGSALGEFSALTSAEFQVTSIDAGPTPLLPKQLRTTVRYELVGSAREFYREQRVGQWDLEWESTAAGEFRLRSWRLADETQSRAAAPVFAEITEQAMGGNQSYSSQLLHGADYWRTVLDVACGIDIYGHNGVSVGDIDNDGYDDLYVCQPAGLPNRLYRNRGDGTFEDITESSGVGILENTACALFADFRNSGHQDLVVVRTDGPSLFVNQGGGRFQQKPGAFQFAQPPQGTFTGAAVADYDRDGWLDIYFCLYLYYQGTDQYKYPSPYYDAENGPPNFLLRNQRDGTFRDVTAESGLHKNNTRYSFCCGWNDYDRDGWPDLYVVNDFGRKNLYHNNGDGTFTDVAAQAGVEDVGAGMGVCWLDSNNDGRDDLYVADMWSAAGSRIASQNIFQASAPEPVRALYRKHARGNSLFRNEDGSFQDVTEAAGVKMGRWAWSSDAWDFDHDGFADLYICNGMVSGPSRADLNSFFWRQVVANSPVEPKPSQVYEQGWNALNELIRSDGTWSGYERNVFFANNGDGTFSDVSGVVELDFIEDGRSFALADFDHDGRLEVFVKNRSGPQLRLLENVMKDLHPSIAFCLRGNKSNRDAIGSVITVQTEIGRQTRSLQAGSGFLSQHTKEVFFGLGDAKGPVRASVRWPSGLVQELGELPLNHRVWAEEGKQPSRMEAFKTDVQNPNGMTPTTSARNGSAPASDPLPTSVETWLLAPVGAPEFSLPDLDGRTHALSAFHGKPLLLNFWVTGSAGCASDLKLFNQRHVGWKERGLNVIAVNVDTSGGVEKIGEFAQSGSRSFPILKGSDDLAGIYTILYRYLFDRHRDLSLPTSFLIDGDGNIVKVYQGPINPEHLEKDFRHIPRTGAERVAAALPFRGVSDTSEFQRNYLNYGSVYFQRGYMDQAEASFRLAFRDDSSSAEALYGLGSVYLKQDKTSQARENFERATKLPASYPDTLANAWNNLGLLATREGRTAEAIPYFEESLELNPDHLIALENLGNAYRQQKNWEDARKTLERAVAVGPQDPEANYSLGMVFAQLEDSDRAYEYLQRALKARPAYPEALNNLGVLYLRTGRRNEAVASFEECIRVAPAFDQSYMNLARVYALEGSPDKAINTLQELLKQHPGHPQALQALEQLHR